MDLDFIDKLEESGSYDTVMDENFISSSGDGSFTLNYKCANCGTGFYSKKRPVFCPVCQSMRVGGVNVDTQIPPLVIPFEKSLKDIKRSYRFSICLNPLIPLKFKSRKTVGSISRVYIPAGIFNMNIQGSVLYLGGDRSVVKKDGSKITETKKYDVFDLVNIDYSNIASSSYSKINQKNFFTVCNYDFDKVVAVDESLLDDENNIIIRSDMNPSDIVENAKKRITRFSHEMVKKSIKHDLKKLKNDGLKVQVKNANEVLLPMYLLTVKYGKKRKIYLVNGQTGFIYTDIKNGIKETIAFFIFLFAVIIGVIYLVSIYF